MTDAARFTIEDNWHGGFYELAIELGDTDDDRLDQALGVLWTAAGVDGSYRKHRVEPAGQEVFPCTLASLTSSGHLYGLVRIPNGVQMLCGAVAVREDGGSDWLDFYLPLGALGRAEPRVETHLPGDPSDTESRSLTWRHPIDEWLAQIGAAVYDATGFRLGLIGWEVSGQAYAADVVADPPRRRGMGYLIPAGEHLRYLPATE